MASKPGKSALQEWCQKAFKGQEDWLPKYTTAIVREQVPMMFQSTVTLTDGRTFTGECFGQKKKAEHSAADAALSKLLGQVPGHAQEAAVTDVSPEKCWSDLRGLLETIFSEQNLLTTSQGLEHYAAAMRRADGAIPLSAIATWHTKMHRLCSLIDERGATSTEVCIAIIARAVELTDGLELVGEGLRVRRIAPFEENAVKDMLKYREIAREKPAEDGALQAEPKAAVVLIPCDPSVPASEALLDLRTSMYYLDELARVLGALDGAHVLPSRPFSNNDHRRMFSLMPRPLPHIGGGATTAVHLSQASDLAANAHASWLLGSGVYGDAVFADVGPGYDTALKWSDTTLDTFFRKSLSRTPRGAYKLSRSAPLLAELPAVFSPSEPWLGKSPAQILLEFCGQRSADRPSFSPFLVEPDGVLTPVKEAALEAGEYTCMASVELRGRKLVASPSRTYRRAAQAVQGAALALCHMVEDFCDNWQADPLGTCDVASGVKQTKRRRLRGDTNTLLQSGPGEAPPPVGALVKIDYAVHQLQGDEARRTHPMEASTDFEFYAGRGMVAAPIDNLILGMREGEVSSLETTLSGISLAYANGTTKEDEPTDVVVQVALTSVKVPNDEERMEVGVFSPPLSKQRYEFVFREIQRRKAESVVDLGCGTGQMMAALAERAPPSLVEVIGVDHNEKYLVKAQKDIEKAHAKRRLSLEGSAPSGNEPKFGFIHGSILDPNPDIHGVDIAMCLEVIEHLDSEPLSKVGDAMLAHIAPHVLIVSTPNIEVNPLISAAASSSDRRARNGKLPAGADDVRALTPAGAESSGENGNGGACVRPRVALRNKDHRFEWTRQEFQEWASNLAHKHNYSVSFDGVGKLPSDVNVGFASQIAIFTRNQVELQVE